MLYVKEVGIYFRLLLSFNGVKNVLTAVWNGSILEISIYKER